MLRSVPYFKIKGIVRSKDKLYIVELPRIMLQGKTRNLMMLQAGPLCFYTTLFHPFSLTAQYGHSGRKIQKREWYKTATLVILFQIVLSCYLKM